MRKVKGYEVWKYGDYCAFCKTSIGALDDACVIGGKPYHWECALRLSGRSEGGEGPPERRWLTREERRALWSKARAIVDSALREAGLRHPIGMKVDGLGPEYARFLLSLREGIARLLAEPKRVEIRVETYAKGFGDTHIFVDNEYLYTWRPQFDPYVSGFWGWVRRVYNLLRTLAEEGLVREEALRG